MEDTTFSFGEEGIWEAEKIVDVKKKNGELQFRVRWQGFGPKDDTWEPQENLLTCEGILSDYKNAHPEVKRLLDAKSAAAARAASQPTDATAGEAVSQRRRAARPTIQEVPKPPVSQKAGNGKKPGRRLKAAAMPPPAASPEPPPSPPQAPPTKRKYNRKVPLKNPSPKPASKIAQSVKRPRYRLLDEEDNDDCEPKSNEEEEGEDRDVSTSTAAPKKKRKKKAMPDQGRGVRSGDEFSDASDVEAQAAKAPEVAFGNREIFDAEDEEGENRNVSKSATAPKKKRAKRAIPDHGCDARSGDEFGDASDVKAKAAKTPEVAFANREIFDAEDEESDKNTNASTRSTAVLSNSPVPFHARGKPASATDRSPLSANQDNRPASALPDNAISKIAAPSRSVFSALSANLASDHVVPASHSNEKISPVPRPALSHRRTPSPKQLPPQKAVLSSKLAPDVKPVALKATGPVLASTILGGRASTGAQSDATNVHNGVTARPSALVETTTATSSASTKLAASSVSTKLAATTKSNLAATSASAVSPRLAVSPTSKSQSSSKTNSSGPHKPPSPAPAPSPARTAAGAGPSGHTVPLGEPTTTSASRPASFKIPKTSKGGSTPTSPPPASTDTAAASATVVAAAAAVPVASTTKSSAACAADSHSGAVDPGTRRTVDSAVGDGLGSSSNMTGGYSTGLPAAVPATSLPDVDTGVRSGAVLEGKGHTRSLTPCTASTGSAQGPPSVPAKPGTTPCEDTAAAASAPRQHRSDSHSSAPSGQSEARMSTNPSLVHSADIATGQSPPIAMVAERRTGVDGDAADDGPLWKPPVDMSDASLLQPAQQKQHASSAMATKGETSAGNITGTHAPIQEQALRVARTTGVSSAVRIANTKAWVEMQAQHLPVPSGRWADKEGDHVAPQPPEQSHYSLSADLPADAAEPTVAEEGALQQASEKHDDFELNLSDSSENSLYLPFGVNMDAKDMSSTGAVASGGSGLGRDYSTPSPPGRLLTQQAVVAGIGDVPKLVSMSKQQHRQAVHSASGNSKAVNIAATAATTTADAQPQSADTGPADRTVLPTAKGTSSRIGDTTAAGTTASIPAVPAATVMTPSQRKMLLPSPPAAAAVAAVTGSSVQEEIAAGQFDFDFDDDPSDDDTAGFDSMLEVGLRPVSGEKVPYNMMKEAVKSGNTHLIEQALRGGFDLEVTEGMQGVTLLMMAADSGQDTSLKLLLSSGAHINTTQRNGTTALMTAADKGFATSCDMLIKAGGYLNMQQSNGETALMKAARKGYVDVAEVLLRAGANTTLTSQLGLTAVDYATRHHREAVHTVIQSHYSGATARLRSFIAVTLQRHGLGNMKLPILALHCTTPGESTEANLQFPFQPEPNCAVNVRLFLVRLHTSSSSNIATPGQQFQFSWISASSLCTIDVYLNNQHVTPIALGGKPVTMYQLWPHKGSNRLRLQVSGTMYASSKSKQQDTICACIYNIANAS